MFYCVLWIYIGGEHTLQWFYITDLGEDTFIFGYPWLHHFNPCIDWTEGQVKDGAVHLETPWLALWMKTHQKSVVKRIQEHNDLDPGDEILVVHKMHIAQEWAIAANKKKKALTEQDIPEEYRWHAKVFSEEAAKCFPPAWPEDHAIKLVLDAPTSINCKVYPLTKAELEVMEKFIKENLELGYIEQSNSPWSTPYFFIKKKDRSLHPIQDYHMVNKYTVHDTYPIPWIEQILEGLHGKELFMALDVHWGYNNIWIKEEDRWKAAFKTPLGLYQPLVMFFGLMNSPATFQWTMDCIFQPLMNEYPDAIDVYMDDIFIKTGPDIELHREIVHKVLDLLEKESFFLKLSKCKFEQTSIDYLGICIEKGVIHIDPTKRDGLANWPQKLHTVKQVCSTLGVLGY
jgi:hypothetical protein